MPFNFLGDLDKWPKKFTLKRLNKPGKLISMVQLKTQDAAPNRCALVYHIQSFPYKRRHDIMMFTDQLHSSSLDKNHQGLNPHPLSSVLQRWVLSKCHSLFYLRVAVHSEKAQNGIFLAGDSVSLLWNPPFPRPPHMGLSSASYFQRLPAITNTITS